MNRKEAVLGLRKATPEQRQRIIHAMDWRDVLKLDAEFEAWAHPSQLPPKGEHWRTWLLMAGRGFGKTRAGAEWVDALARSRPGLRIALAGATIAEARSVMVEGVSGILAVARNKRLKVVWEPSLGRLRWPNGSVAELFSGDHPDGFRGPEHDAAWADELAKWGKAEEAWANLQLGLRRGSRPRVLVTTTPRPGGLLKQIGEQDWTVTTRGRTADNINLDEKFVEVMMATYGGTRIGRQELDGELIADVEGALWTRELIEQSRSAPFDPSAKLRTGFAQDERSFDKIFVGVDPPAGVRKSNGWWSAFVRTRLRSRVMWPRCGARSKDRWSPSSAVPAG